MQWMVDGEPFVCERKKVASYFFQSEHNIRKGCDLPVSAIVWPVITDCCTTPFGPPAVPHLDHALICSFKPRVH